MSYGRHRIYPEYKDSGLEWLGPIPRDWKLCPLKFLAKIMNGQDYKHVEADNGFPVMGSGGRFTYASKFMYDRESVLLGRKGTIDKPLYINEPFWTVDTMYYTEIEPTACAKFVYYLALTIQFKKFSTNTALPSMTQENLGNYVFAVPSNLPEQTQIAKFLDHETAKIDRLIEKQEALIRLLKEKRQAVISHAVTKGLNPHAPLKDSGIEWLGQVPAHWEVSKIKHLCYVNDGNHGEEYPKDTDYTDEQDGVPFIRGGNMQDLTITSEGMIYITKAKNASMRKGRLQEGDILFMNRGEIGKLAMVPLSFEGANLNSQIAYLRCESPRIDRRYLLNFLSSDAVRAFIESLKMGSVLTQFPIGDLIQIAVPMPPEEEQTRMTSFIEAALAQFAALEMHARNAIQLMQERRTALISAAATGKIDVRHWQPPSSPKSSAS